MKAAGKKRSRGKYSFGGCGTCRRRHVKCDQVRPSCLTCRAIGVTCDGFQNELKWMTNAQDLAANGKDCPAPRRKQLYTEESRASMSSALQSDLPAKPIEESLLELDDKCVDVSTEGVSIGPFGVFSTQPLKSAGDSSSMPYSADYLADIQTELGDTEFMQALDDPHHYLDNVDSFSNIDIDNLLDWPDLFDIDSIFSWPSPQTVCEPLREPVSTTSLDRAETSASDLHIAAEQSRNLDVCDQHDESFAPAANTSSLQPPPAPCLDSEEAQLLLKHFKDHVIDHMWSMPVGQRSPLEIHLDSAVTALARLTYLSSQRVSHAARANLLALLGLSAAHLESYNKRNGVESTKPWSNIGAQLMEKARENLQFSLRTEITPKLAKYKDLVMAVSARLAWEILHDRQKDARDCMVELEKLLRTCGLAKRTISRKARLLHHTYTWNRIVGESTYVLHSYKIAESSITCSQITRAANSTHSSHRIDARIDATADHVSGPNPRLDDFLRLESSQPPSNDDTDADLQENDIHLEESRGKSESTFQLLYGISETWLSLVSRTTRLANVMEEMRLSKQMSDAAVLDCLETRKQRLETKVCSFAMSNSSSSNNRQDQGQEKDQLLIEETIQQRSPRENMVRALNCALVIFFYRRIRKVNPCILQEHVNNVIRALKDFDASCKTQGMDGPGSPWPAFMAGCEAMAPEQRAYLSSWLDISFAKTGFSRLQTCKTCMHEVWKRRDEARDSNNEVQLWTWIEVSKEQKLYPLLS